MQRAGLINEVSLLLAPVADGRIGSPALFEVEAERAGASPWRLTLVAIERRGGDMLMVALCRGGDAVNSGQRGESRRKLAGRCRVLC